MITLAVVITMFIAIALATMGVVFLIIGTLSNSVTGYGRTVLSTGKVFLWSGMGLLIFLILTMIWDLSGLFN